MFAYCNSKLFDAFEHVSLYFDVLKCFGSETMSEWSDAEIRRTQEQLESVYDNIQRWGVRSRMLDESVERVRLVIGQLATEVHPLRGALRNVRTHHTPATWTGTAATRSRRRLDQHEDRCASAVRVIDHLIDDLETHALRTAALADDAHTNLERERRSARSIERTLAPTAIER